MREDRQYTRHEISLAVRFSSASEFVSEYAENLSAGGLFVRKAQHLEPLSEVEVVIELPGSGTFTVKAKVAHVMTEEMATQYKRHAGAGLQLTSMPAGFEQALMEYLSRLGRRRDALILVEDADCLRLLEDAGFRTTASDLAHVTEQVMSSKILAIVARRSSAANFRSAIAIAPGRPPVIGCDAQADQEPLLVELDRLTVASAG